MSAKTDAAFNIGFSIVNPVFGAFAAVANFIGNKPSQSRADRAQINVGLPNFIRDQGLLIPRPGNVKLGKYTVKGLKDGLQLVRERASYRAAIDAAAALGWTTDPARLLREVNREGIREQPELAAELFALAVGQAALKGLTLTPSDVFPRIGSSRTQGAWLGLAAGLAPLALEALPVPAGELDTARAFAGTSPIPEILVVAPAALPAVLPALGRAAAGAFAALTRGTIKQRGRRQEKPESEFDKLAAQKKQSEFDKLIQPRTIEPGTRARPPPRRAPPTAPMPLPELEAFLRRPPPGGGSGGIGSTGTAVGGATIPEIIVRVTRPIRVPLPRLARIIPPFAGSVANVLPELGLQVRPPPQLAPSSSPASEPASSTRTAPAPGTSVSIGPSLSALIGAGNAIFGRPGRGFSFQPGAEFAALPGLQTQTATAGQGDGGDVCRVVCSAPRKRRKGKPKKCFTPGQLGAYVRSKRKSA